jgi:hypothetical protein
MELLILDWKYKMLNFNISDDNILNLKKCDLRAVNFERTKQM